MQSPYQQPNNPRQTPPTDVTPSKEQGAAVELSSPSPNSEPSSSFTELSYAKAEETSPALVKALLQSSGVFPASFTTELTSARVRCTGARRNSFTVYRVTLKDEEFVVRFPPNETKLFALQREAQLTAELRAHVQVLLPEPEIVLAAPVFSVHRRIPGRSVTSKDYEKISLPEKDRLAGDLTDFLEVLQSVSLEQARTVLKVQGTEGQVPLKLKPDFFSPAVATAMRQRLAEFLPRSLQRYFDATMTAFHELPEDVKLLTLAHGDLWYRNMSFSDDAVGVRLKGIFDFGAAGIMDVHDELFRLGMFGADLMQRVVKCCAALERWQGLLQPERVELYHTAFLFHMTDLYRRLGRDDTASLFRRKLFDKLKTQD